MGWDDKVVWSEGMFLKPQHFQQFDRYVERLVRGRTEGLHPYGWGLTELTLNRDVLKTGQFALASAAGVFIDGTPFRLPEDADHPEPLELTERTRDSVIYLGVPLRQPGAAEFARPNQGDSPARYAAQEFEAADAILGKNGISRLGIGRLRLRYLLESDDRSGYACIGLARVREVQADRRILLDDSYIPTVLACRVSGVLAGLISELLGLLHTRGEALAAIASAQGTRTGAGQLSDFLLLLAVNRYEALFTHYAAGALLHPENLYAAAVAMAGEFAAFTAINRRLPPLGDYHHEDLRRSFAPLMVELRRSLSAIIEPTAIAIPLQERRSGMRAGVIADKSLIKTARFVLCVQADMAEEALRRNLPAQIAIGPVEQIRELVTVQLSGISIRALPVAPREMPYHAGASYFELDRASPYFAQLAASGGIALHISGDFPGVTVELWAIKG